MIFHKLVHLHVFQGLPFDTVISFDEVDPASPVHTRPLDITGRTLVAQVSARPKSKAYKIEILEDPPAPGDYLFLIKQGGIEYEVAVTLPAGETAKYLQEHLIEAIKSHLLAITTCATKCSHGQEIVLVHPWPGVEWTLELVEQPEADQVEVDLLQGNAPLVLFTVTSQATAEVLAVRLKLSTAQTGAIPAAGDGPYMWRLTAPVVTDPGDPDEDPPVAPTIDPDDALTLARGYLTVGRA